MSTKRELRKRTYGNFPKWKDEYEWLIKAAGGRNVKLSKQVTKESNLDSNTKGKIALFIEKYKYNYAEVKEDEIKRRHKRTFAVIITLWVLTLCSRLI